MASKIYSKDSQTLLTRHQLWDARERASCVYLTVVAINVEVFVHRHNTNGLFRAL